MKINFTHRKTMRRLLLLAAFTLTVCSGRLWAQPLTGTKTIPGDYATIAAAVTDLNSNGVGAGGIVINVAAGYAESISATISLTATGTAANPIVFQKSGFGANPVIFAYTGGTATPASATQDGIWRLVGSDYVTIDGIDLTENSANTSNPSTMEYGFAFYKASLSDGAQNNTIKNCTITLSNVNNATGSGPTVEGSTGIVVMNTTATSATSSLVPTARVGTNSYNKFYSNTIKNVNYGIAIIGYQASSPYAAADTLNDIGGSSLATGNTIVNFGGAATAANPTAGIRTLAQYSLNVSYNTINNNDGSGTNHVSTLRGVLIGSATNGSALISNNTITLKSGGTTSSLIGIENASGGSTSSTIGINNNIIQNFEYLTATSAAVYGIYNTSSPALLNINSNTINGLTYSAAGLTGSGTISLIYNTGSATVVNSNDNIINNVYRIGTTGGSLYGIYISSGTTQNVLRNSLTNFEIAGTGTSGDIRGFYVTGTTIRVDTNTINNLTISKSTGTSTLYGIYNFGSPSNENYNKNTITNLIHAGAGGVSGIYTNTAAGVRTVSRNLIHTLSNVGALVTGITQLASTPSIYGNKIYDLKSEGAAGSVYGISLSSGSGVISVYQNIVGDLRAPSASGADVIRGISVTNTSTTTAIGVYYNSVYLNATSTGTNFGSTGIYHTTSGTGTTAALDLRNNIIVNTSTPAGTGLTVAYRRSSNTLTNYATTSNNNLYYAGTPGTSALLFYDGTNADQTIGALKTRFVNRDQASISELPVWASTVGTDPNFLNISLSSPTQIESHGANIATFTADFGGNIRQGNPGYPTQVNGGGTAPDIGAWEFDGVPLSAPILSAASYTPAVQCVAASHTVNVNVLPGSGSITSVTLNYSFDGVAQSPITMSNSGGNTYSATIPAATPANAVVSWNVVASNSVSLSSSINGTSYADEPLTGHSLTISNNANPVCSGTPVKMLASLSKTANFSIGNAGTTLGTTTTQQGLTPFSQYYEAAKTQYLVMASDLLASGMRGGIINSVAFNVTNAASTLGFTDFSMRMANTTATNLTFPLTPAFTNVFGPAIYPAVTTTGSKVITFTNSFVWDGVSNVVIELCFANDPNSTGNIYSSNSTVAATTKTYTATYGYYADNANICSSGGTNVTSTSLPDMTFNASIAMNAYSWSDGTTTVGTGNPLTISPTSSTQYSVTATDVNGCVVSSTTPYSLNVISTSLSGTKTVGLTGDYPTLTAAVNAYNDVCSLTGPVTFSLIDPAYNSTTGEVFPIVIKQHSQASSTNTLTIKPASGVTTTINGKSNVAIIHLRGADYVTIDGSNNGTTSRDLTIANDSNASVGTVVWITSDDNSGANVNVVKNTNINGYSSSTTIAGILSGSYLTMGNDAEFANNRNVIANNWIRKAQNAMYLRGNGTNFDSAWIVRDNLMGSTNAAEKLSFRGALIGNAKNFVVTMNRVFGVNSTTTSSATVAGLQVAFSVQNGDITKNVISDIKQLNTTAYSATGIVLGASTTASALNVVNNTVTDVTSSGSATVTSNGIGLAINSGGGYNVYFNSINMNTNQSLATSITSALYVSSSITTANSLDIRNNVFANTQTNTATRYAVYSAAANTVFANINYNDYYTAGSAIGYLTSNRTAIADWRTATGKDANSIDGNPLLAPTINVPGIGSPVVGSGIAISGITSDIIDSVRSATPTIGAYEKARDLAGPVITYTALTNDFNPPGSRVLTNFATITDPSGVNVNTLTKPRLYFKVKQNANAFVGNTSADNGWKWVEATNTTSPFSFNIDYSLVYNGFVNHLDVIQYFVVAQDNIIPANLGAKPFAGIVGTDVANLTSAPTAVDSFTVVNLPALTGTYSIGATQTSPNYTSITAALADLNLRGVSSAVEFVLVDPSYTTGETFPLQLKPYIGASAVNTVTIKPSTGVNATIAGSNAQAIFKFSNKAQYFIIDGSNSGTNTRNLNIVNTSTATSSVVWFEGLNIGEGVRNSVLKNTIIKGGSNASSLGVLVGGNLIGLSSSGIGHGNVSISNNNIYNCYYAVVVSGSSLTLQVQDVKVDHNDIGTDTSTLNNQYYGVYTINANRIVVQANHIFNVRTTGFINNAAIQVSGNTTNSTFSSNKIHGIYSTSSSGYGAYGINVESNTADNDSIYNNLIYDVITSNYNTTSTTYNAFGIRLAGGSNLKIYHNSVHLYGQPTSGTSASSSAAFLILDNTYAGIDVKNNSFTNTMTGAYSGSKHYSYWTTRAATFTNASFNNNNFAAWGTYGILMNGSGTDLTTIQALSSATGANANSISLNPNFQTNDSLVAGAGAFNGLGTSIATILTDVTGLVRNNPPFIGAYEFDNGKDLNPPVITFTPIPTNPELVSLNLNGFATITDVASGVNTQMGTAPRLYFKNTKNANVFVGNTSVDDGWKWVEASNTTSPFSFTINYSLLFNGSLLNKDTIQYFIVAQDNALVPNVGSSPANGFVGTSVAAITSAPTTPNRFIVVADPPLNGTYLVGSTQTSPNYTTITAAVNDLALRGVSGPVTFSLTDASYGSSETFPIQFRSYAGASSVNTVTIKPASGIVTAITGSSSQAIIKFVNKAEYYTLDGSNGVVSKDLTIENTSTSTSSVVWFEGLNATEGVKNSVVKNSIIKGGSNGSSFGVLIGGSTISLASAGMGTDKITVSDNEIFNCYYAIVVSGSAGGRVQNVKIERNEIGTTSSGMENQYYGVYTTNADRVIINKNHIFNVKTSGSLNNAGVYIDANTVNSTISNNNIHGIYSTSSGGWGAFGVNVVSSTLTDNDSIYNNVVYDILTSNYSLTSTLYNAFGIRLAGGSNMKIYHNSVNIYGQPTTGTSASSSAAFLVLDNTYAGIDVRNNSFTNSMTGAITGSKHYAFWTTRATPITSAIFDNNNFYASGIHGVLMNGNGTDITSLANLKTATASNASSISVAPYFTANDILVPGLAIYNAKGISISSINSDIEGAVRANPPFIGAYERNNPSPVVLLNFTAVKKSEDGVLSWVTASEVNNKGFAIERSLDGKTFEQVHFVTGKGNSNVKVSYSYTDAGVFAKGLSKVYYRLKQVDNDGKYSYSSIVMLANELNNGTEISAYPNPFSSDVTVSVNTTKAGSAKVEVYDISGRKVLATNYEVVEGSNALSITQLSELQTGIYFVKVQVEGQEKVIKLVKN